MAFLERIGQKVNRALDHIACLWVTIVLFGEGRFGCGIMRVRELEIGLLLYVLGGLEHELVNLLDLLHLNLAVKIFSDARPLIVNFFREVDQVLLEVDAVDLALPWGSRLDVARPFNDLFSFRVTTRWFLSEYVVLANT